MQQGTSGGWRIARRFLSLAVFLAAVPTAWAYINGGDFRSTRGVFEQQLRRAGWAVSVGEPFFQGQGVQALKVKVGEPEHEDLRTFTNQLVSRALNTLPEKEREEIPTAVKQEIARVALEVLYQGAVKGTQSVKEGRAGAIVYQVGFSTFETYWETNYPKEGRKIHARKTYWVPLVAVRTEKEEGKDSR